MKSILIATAFLFSGLGWAGTPGPVDCWDGSFAYTMTSVTPMNESGRFYVIKFSSENQRLFKDLLNAPQVPAWGNLEVKVLLEASNCITDKVREDVLACSNGSRPVSFDVTYSDTQESDRTLHLIADKLSYSTKISSGTFAMDFTYEATSKINPRGTAHLEFDLRGANKCRAFNH